MLLKALTENRVIIVIYKTNIREVIRHMEELELLCFQIISAAGTARSDFIEAIKEVKNGNSDKANELMEEGKQQFLQGHNVHSTLLAREAGGENIIGSILVMHAEDQLMSAETFQIIANEFIDTYLRMIKLENQVKLNSEAV